MKLLILSLLLLCFFNVATAQRIINVDVNMIKGERNEMYRECIGAGRAEEGLRADWQQQLRDLQKVIPFKYIRFHGLLDDDMHIYDEDANGKPIYNWQYLDKLYDFLLSINIKPFVEIGFMPPALASGTKTVFWYKANVTPPKSYEKWAGLITAMIKHWEERYGHAEVKTWYFEVWNEPNLEGFFAGTQDEYFKLYEVTAKAIKSTSTEYRVGGPATAKSAWVMPFLTFCNKNKVPVDFISTHNYNTRSVFDEFGTNKRKLLAPDYLYQNVKFVRRVIDSTAYKGLPLHYTEFNSSPSSRDPIHDTYQNAPYILNTLRRSEDAVASMSYWTFTDIFEEAGPALTPFHGGFGLVNLQGIRKPTYYAYQFLSELKKQELVSADPNSIATKDKKGYQVLAWNLKFPTAETIYDEDYFKNELPAKPDGNLDINLKGITQGAYKVLVYQTGYQHNDVLSAYYQMAAPFYFNRKQEWELNMVASGRPVKTVNINVTSGTWHIQLPLKENDVYLVKLVKR